MTTPQTDSTGQVEIEQRIAAIRERLDNASSGHWTAVHGSSSDAYVRTDFFDDPDDDGGDGVDADMDLICTVRAEGEAATPEDADFIAHAHVDVPWLLEQLDSIPAQIAAAVQAERDRQWNGLDEFIDSMQASDNDDGTRLRAAWDLCDTLTAAIRARGEVK